MFDIGLVVSIQAIYPDNPSLNPAVFNFLLLFYKLLSEKVSGGSGWSIFEVRLLRTET